MGNSKDSPLRASWLVGENASLSGMHRWRAIHLCMGGMPGGTVVDASDHPYVGPCGIPAQPITTMSETKLDATTCSYPWHLRKFAPGFTEHRAPASGRRVADRKSTRLNSSH